MAVDLDRLKAKLADVPGFGSLSVTNIAGRKVYGFNGVMAAVDPKADEAETERAIRKAAAMVPPKLPAPAVPMPPVTTFRLGPATPLPLVSIQPARTKSMAVTGASHAGMSLKDMMAKHKQKIADAQAHVETQFAKLDQAGDAMQKLGDSVGAEADDLMATIGQFSNSIGGE